jgi:polyisoprenoid-binding protein YceI
MKFLTILLVCAQWAHAQKYISEKSEVKFFSDAPLEDIAATNTKAIALIDISSGEFAFSVPIKDFEFEKTLMKEHFNEKYMETEKYPKSSFQGKFVNLIPSKGGEQSVSAKGKLTIHGVAKEVEIPGTINIEQGKIQAKAVFTIKLADYKIKIPKIVWQNIAEQVEVTVDFQCKPQ